MSAHRVIDQRAQFPFVSARRSARKGAHADVARRHASEHRTGTRVRPPHRLARGGYREAASGRYSQRRHRLADDVLAQHRPEGRASVTPLRKRRRPRALELDVEARARRRDLFAQQDGASIAQRGEVAVLVP